MMRDVIAEALYAYDYDHITPDQQVAVDDVIAALRRHGFVLQ
jgi:hypothetical protein